MTFDWGAGTVRVIRDTFLDKPSSVELMVVLAILAALGLTAWSLTERIPVYLHAYTVVVALMAFTTSAAWVSSKPRSPARRPARPPGGPPAGPAADFGAGFPHRGADGRIDLVRHVPRDHRQVGALRVP